jgi:hypothetical protein
MNQSAMKLMIECSVGLGRARYILMPSLNVKFSAGKKSSAAAAILLAILIAGIVLTACPNSAAQDQTQDQAQQQAPPPSGQASDQGPPSDQPPASDQAPYANLSPEQLGRLVAPIALYPDSLVAQVLAASTFPSQLADAEDWLKAHPGLSTTELGAEVDRQTWDPSVKALVPFPSVLANLATNLGWTSELGDAYYNQPQDVMAAVQDMRRKAQKAGHLKPTPQLSVNDDPNGQVDIAPVDPDEVYVPAYDPWIVYGYPIAPWPYWVEVPGIWWGGPGLYFGIGFPIAPFFGFGWGWHSWGVDWYHHQVFYNRAPYYARGPAFFNRGAYYGGHPDMGRGGGFRAGPEGRGGEGRGAESRGGDYRGFSEPRGGTGVRSGAFNGVDHGGATRGFSARGQQSFNGGFHGGGFHGGGFHGGGGGRH